MCRRAAASCPASPRWRTCAWRGRADSGEIEAGRASSAWSTRCRGCAPLLDRKGGALSGGEQQILALGRALMPAPWLLLLDEPSEGIQPSIVQEIGEILATLRRRDKLSLLVVEQNLDLVLDVADRIVVSNAAASSARSTRMRCKPAAWPSCWAWARRAQPQCGAIAQPAAHGAAPACRARHRAACGGHERPRHVCRVRLMPARLHPLPAPRLAEPAAIHRGDTMAMVKRPTIEQLQEIVSSLHMSMSEREVGEYLDVLEGTMQAYDRVDQLPDYLPEVRYPRTPGTRPSASENPLGAWDVKSEVKGAPYGPLAGKRVVLKDNICLAGVPMMNGASTLEGYVPDVDATVVTRILDAGGTIVGKAHCEYFCLSGGSHTSAAGPVHNPYKIGYSAGGSSSGCAALVGAGEVEMAIGGDQGGSIRMPGRSRAATA